MNLDRAELASRLQALFKHDAQKSGVPLVVLVHNETLACAVLTSLGIDITSYASGIEGLLVRGNKQVTAPTQITKSPGSLTFTHRVRPLATDGGLALDRPFALRMLDLLSLSVTIPHVRSPS